MEIIIEILARQGRVQERHKLQGSRFSIGRGYQSDIIVSDPYVCPLHVLLQFDPDEQHWKLVDQSTRNGTFLVGKGLLQQTHIVQSGDEFDLGETRVRLLLPQHEVPATRKLPKAQVLEDYLASPWTALALLVSTLGLFAFVQYLGQGTETRLQELLLQALMFLAVPFIWACVWGLIGRIAVHEARFSFQLSLGSLLAVGLLYISIGADYLAFGFSDDGLVHWLDAVGEGAIIMLFLVVALRVATRMQRRGRWVLANGIAWSVIGISVLTFLVKSDPYEQQAQMAFDLKPPFAQWQTPQSLDTFMAEAEQTFAVLQEFQE